MRDHQIACAMIAQLLRRCDGHGGASRQSVQLRQAATTANRRGALRSGPDIACPRQDLMAITVLRARMPEDIAKALGDRKAR